MNLCLGLFSVCAPLTLASSSRKTKSNRGWPALQLSEARRISTDACVGLHYWVVIWVAGYFDSPSYCTACIMALRSYSVLDILLPTIIIIMQECSQALRMCKCLLSLSCGGVSNMLLFLSNNLCHYFIWGCMCSTGLFQFRWSSSNRRYQLYHCYIFRGFVPEMFIASYSVTYCIYIPGRPWFCSHHYCAVNDEYK